ncbi:MAG: hypothetical protein ACREBW_05090 [Candidatus Micrarchaeaceae archaeon]
MTDKKQLFTVRRTVDAFVYYETEVEAESPKQAAIIAERDEDKFKWENCGTTEYDARRFETLDADGEPVEDTRQG